MSQTGLRRFSLSVDRTIHPLYQLADFTGTNFHYFPYLEQFSVVAPFAVGMTDATLVDMIRSMPRLRSLLLNGNASSLDDFTPLPSVAGLTVINLAQDLESVELVVGGTAIGEIDRVRQIIPNGNRLMEGATVGGGRAIFWNRYGV